MNRWRFESGLSLIIAVGVCVSIAGAGSPPATSRRADETHAAEYDGRRVVLLEENWPREVLEFQRPKSDNKNPSA